MALQDYTMTQAELDAISAELEGTPYVRLPNAPYGNLSFWDWVYARDFYQEEATPIAHILGAHVVALIDNTWFDDFPTQEARDQRRAFYFARADEYWASVRRQLHEAICGKEGVYEQEREAMHGSVRTFITLMVPVIMDKLDLPTGATGVAIALSLLIWKINVQAFCETAGPAGSA